MRSDMDKLLCERPRRGSDLRKYGRYYDDIERDPESAPTFERIRMRRTKELNENLKPLLKFLSSNVGRPWDKVYSEIREHFDKSSATKLHIFQHLEGYVERNAVYLNGKYYEPRAYSKKSPTYEVTGFFVDRMGILRNAPTRRYRAPKREENPNVVKLSTHRYLLRMNDCWFLGNMKNLPEKKYRWVPYTMGNRISGYQTELTVAVADPYLKGSHFHQDFVQTYGAAVYCASVRQLNKREIRRLVKK